MKAMINKIFGLLIVMTLSITWALGANIKKDAVIYFDASEYPEIQQSIAEGKSLQMLLGHSSYSTGYKLNPVAGVPNLYSVKMAKWDGCTELAFMTVDKDKIWGSDDTKTVSDRVQYGYQKTGVYKISSDISGSVTFVGNPLVRINKYPVSITYTLMGVGNDWSKGIAFEPNPDNEGEFMLLNQVISNSKDALKVVPVDNAGAKLAYYSDVKDSPCSAKVSKDKDGNIKLPDGTYDFYYKAGEIYITPSESAMKYVLMGINKDWTTGIELTQNPDNEDELMLLGQEISKATDAIKIVKKTPCGDEFYAAIKKESPVPYSGGGPQSAAPNIVLEDGIYDFYFNKETGEIYIEGTLNDSYKVFLDPKVYNEKSSGVWTSDDARIAVYCYQSKGSNTSWVTAVSCNSYYYAQIPNDYDKYIWARINPDKENSFDNAWNQTSGITYDAEKTLTKLTSWSDDDGKATHYQTTYNGICGENYDDLNCTFPEVKDTVFVEINQFVESNPCNYLFKSFEQAFAVLKTNNEICEATTNNYGTLKEDEITFKKPVVMLVHFGPSYYRGSEKVGMSGGHINDAPAIFFRNINKNGGAPLIVRTAYPRGNRAVLVHPVIRRSRNIELNNLDIISDKNLRDNALDIDTGEGDNNLEGYGTDFNVVPLAKEDHNITIKNCFVESYGRNGIHVVGIKGIHVENNEFYTKYDFSINREEGDDVVDWGGTIKFINTTDVKFLRNNSEGTLATSFFIQGCQRVLLMNNVFWNDNAVSVPNLSTNGRTVANVRLVNFGERADEFPVKNIGIYYNTFFIKSNESSDVGDSYVTFDFFRLGGLKQIVDNSNKANFEPNTIRFQYNNCYSYDEDIKGNNDDATNTTTFYLQGIGRDNNWCQCFRYNNFWSQYDADHDNTSSSFEIGKFCVNDYETYNLYTSVVDEVCKTEPTRPGALIVKGDGLNIGTVIKEDVSLQGADKIFNDRLNPDNGVNSIRPQMAVDNSNESLVEYDHIYKEPGTINLYTSPIVGSQTTDVHISSLKLTGNSKVNLSLVDENDNIYLNNPVRFTITDDTGKNNITDINTDASGNIDDKPVYVTFIRPEGVKEETTYSAFLKVVPSNSNDAQLILRIPIRGHYVPEITKIGGAWTVGAFQQRKAMPVDTIIWNGSASTEWDNRNNWYKTDGTLVTCIDALTEDLTVIIPNRDSEKYVTPPAGIVQFPILPNISNDSDFKNRGNGEQVNAGDNSTATKIAHKIFMEYGAALVGVEKLGNNRYSEAEVEFTARRYDWLLVGCVVNPWELDENGNQVLGIDDKPKTRQFVSGDYFLHYKPHVYMHEAKLIDESGDIVVGWNESFAPLDVPVVDNKVFAIRLPNQYGNTYSEKLPAVVYNRRNEGANFDSEKPHTYSYEGRFYNDSNVPTYTNLTPGKPVLLTNTYPANIDADELQKKGYTSGNDGTYLIYDYDKESFVPVGGKDAVILSQHGFVFTPANEQLVIGNEYFLNNETGHRSLIDDVLSLRIQIKNEKSSVSSEVYISYDELKEDIANYSVDAPKVFNGMSSALPDLYVMRYDKYWAGLSVPDITKPIPLGIRVSADNQTFTFSLLNSNLPFDIFLEDRQEEKTYNLSAGEVCEVGDLVKGKSEGRFYLLLSEKPKEEIPEDDVTTEVEETETANAIDIFTQGSTVVVSASDDVELQKVIVSDVAGRHQVYNVSGQYIKLDLPVNTGVYTISVIGDKASRIEKVRLFKKLLCLL